MTTEMGWRRSGLCPGRRRVAFSVSALFVVVLAAATSSAGASSDFCRQIGKCCDDRKDECSVPLNGTRCYCDTFCDRGPMGNDCCQDYWSYCKDGDHSSNIREVENMLPNEKCISNNNDDDLLFFISLHQTMKTFPKHIMAETKNRLFQIVNQTERSLLNIECVNRTAN